MNIWILLLLLAVLFYQFYWSRRGISSIQTSELNKVLQANGDAQFIDVRTPGEFGQHHIKAFRNIPLAELNRRMDELARDKEVYVICQSGMRSSKACQLLKRSGFTNVTNVAGGMSRYRN